eukprot:5152918-Amphidinium_carterae.1
MPISFRLNVPRAVQNVRKLVKSAPLRSQSIKHKVDETTWMQTWNSCSRKFEEACATNNVDTALRI